MSVGFYEDNAHAYFEATVGADVAELRARFLNHIRPGARILDAGCGSGRDLRAFAQAGYDAIGFDASANLARLAAAHSGRPVTVLRFQDMAYVEAFDGIWACASLLHVPRDGLDDVLRRCLRALQPNGVMYASFKEGHTSRADGARVFTDMTDKDLQRVFETTGFAIADLWTSDDVRPQRTERWVNVVAAKAIQAKDRSSQ